MLNGQFLVQSVENSTLYRAVDFTGKEEKKAICRNCNKDICEHILTVMLHQSFDLEDYFQKIFQSDPPKRKRTKTTKSLTNKVRNTVSTKPTVSLGIYSNWIKFILKGISQISENMEKQGELV
jgi:hypothetical protein